MMTRRFPLPALAMLVLAAAHSSAQAPPEFERPESSLSTRTQTAYPTGDPATSVILLERIIPAEVRANTKFEYHVKLTNLTSGEIRDVVLTEQFPPQLKVLASGPRAQVSPEGHGVWKWARLGPGASEIVRIQGIVDRTATLPLCGTVTFAESFCGNVTVVEPQLALTKTAPREVILCDPIPLQFVVTNRGSGVARNVRIVDRLPTGLVTAGGKSNFLIRAGDLAAGQSREFSVSVRATQTGEYRNTATAEDDSGLTAEASAMITVRQPALVVTKRGPDLRYVGRMATFEITVQNVGDAPAVDTVLTDAVSPGAEIMAAEGGTVEEGRAVWNLGTLAPRASRSVQVSIKLHQIGAFRNTATAEAHCASAAATAGLQVQGVPAILLEVVDDPDPIEVGSNVTYTIAVTNQGSAVGTNIVVHCTLPPELRFVSATGPSANAVDGQEIRFAPLASLAPKATVTYKVVAQGTQESDARFKVTLTSDQTTSPVEETESTHTY